MSERAPSRLQPRPSSSRPRREDATDRDLLVQQAWTLELISSGPAPTVVDNSSIFARRLSLSAIVAAARVLA
jgi:hypothetical protein